MVVLTDSNDNPPTFLQHSYTSLIDEGVITFEPPLIVQVSEYIFSINLNKLLNVKFLNLYSCIHVFFLFKISIVLL